MLVRFSLENWMSFRDRTMFSMIASRERQHKERISSIGKYRIKLLPIAALYGGNASGKTNFFKALSFAKDFVVTGTHPDSLISVEPFRLNESSLEKPSSFVFEILIDEVIYEFSFAVTKEAVFEEKLVKIINGSEKILYERSGNNNNLHESFKDKERDYLEFAFKGTRDNQLFLTNAVSQKVKTFEPIYDWFKHSLSLVGPDSAYRPFEQWFKENHPLYEPMRERLLQLDTGIVNFGNEKIHFESSQILESFKGILLKTVEEGQAVSLPLGLNGEPIAVTKENGELIANRIVTFHSTDNGAKVKFGLHQESDGTQRVINLLPAFLELTDAKFKKVYIIDEIDRSLHTLLTRSLIEDYLESCSAESRKQLLFTTHDVLLMDQKVFRRDEMWVSERDDTGTSKLFSFSDYADIRYDKDIRKSYLQGRIGGIPRLLI